MSGDSVPYHLRPHKAVDRRLFLDLLARIERWSPLSDHIYMSMGAYPLEDHKLIHRHVGIKKLIAFDLDGEVVARQVFNRPIESCHCLHKKSGELIDELDRILAECSFIEPTGVIVWLDYTDPKQLGQQIREFETLLNKLSVGDVVRVTVNAQPNMLTDPHVPGTPRPLAEELRAKQFQRLKERIRDFLPTDTSADDMTPEGLPLAISRSFGAAALAALPPTGDGLFCPLSIIRYADGAQMLSITGAIIARDEKDAFLEELHLKSWPFASTDWSQIHHLVVPALTPRERLFLERGIISKTAEEITSELGFKKASDIPINQFLESYKKYYRFYPTMLHTEI